jgi:hypothetical protein
MYLELARRHLLLWSRSMVLRRRREPAAPSSQLAPTDHGKVALREVQAASIRRAGQLRGSFRPWQAPGFSEHSGEERRFNPPARRGAICRAHFHDEVGLEVGEHLTARAAAPK